MTRIQTANLAIGLAVLSPVLLFFGLVWRLAWYPPRFLSIATINALADAAIAAGILSTAAVLWLSGFSYSAAPRRSLVALSILLAPVPAAWLWSL